MLVGGVQLGVSFRSDNKTGNMKLNIASFLVILEGYTLVGSCISGGLGVLVGGVQ